MGTRLNDIWITGALGYLGRALTRRFADAGYTVYATGREVDVCDLDEVTAFISRNRPSVVVNCAGIRRDFVSAENRLETMKTNALGARNLAIATESIDTLLVQVSSDDVFARHQSGPLDEFDRPDPDTLYGKSKLAGESFVRELNPRHLIVRSSWVYHADGGQLGSIIECAKTGAETVRRADQVACPTSVDTMVRFLLEAIREGEYGTFHVVDKGSCSRSDFARAVYCLMGADPALVHDAPADPTTSENVVLDDMMIALSGLAEPPSWQDDIRAYLGGLGLVKAGA